MADDYYGDPITQQRKLTSGGMYYYLLTPNHLSSLQGENMLAVPPTDCVVNVCLYPYLNGHQTVLTKQVTFDTERFPLANNVDLGNKTLLRIVDLAFQDKEVGRFNRYPATTLTPHFSYLNESKLLQYPFTRLELNDHLSTPLHVIPHLFPDQENAKSVKVKHVLNNQGMYLMYVEGYKNDVSGLNEGTVTAGLQIPVTSSFYMDYMARSQESLKTSRTNSALSMVSSAVGGAMVGAKFGAGLGPYGAVAGMATGALMGGMGLASNYAQERDALNTPATLKVTGGDALFNAQVADNKLYLYRLQYHPTELERIGWYFHLNGYAQNKVMKVDLNSRQRFNYVKTVSGNVTGRHIHKEHLIQLKSIFDNGVRIWHVDNPNVTMLDYTLDNREVR